MSETIKLSYVSVRDYEGKENVRYILLWKIGDLVCYSKGENVFTAKGESSMKKVVLLYLLRYYQLPFLAYGHIEKIVRLYGRKYMIP